MPFIPVIQTQAQLQAFIDAFIKANGNNEITGDILGQFLSNLTASLVNKIDNVNLLGLSNFDTLRAYKGGTVGDCCIKDGSILQCVTDTQGVFSSADWKVVLGVVPITRSAYLTLAAAGQVNINVTYLLTDKLVYFKAVDSKQVVTDGIKIYRTPRYKEDISGNIIYKWDSYTPGIIGSGINSLWANGGVVYKQLVASPGGAPTVGNVTEFEAQATNNDTYYKNFITVCTYDIFSDQLLSVRDQYSNRYSSNVVSLEEFGASSWDLSFFRWGDPDNFGCNLENCFIDQRNDASCVQNITMMPGSKLTFAGGGCGFAKVKNSQFGNGANLIELTLQGVSEMTGMIFEPGADFTQKTLIDGTVLNNWKIGIVWSSPKIFGGTINNVVILKEYSNYSESVPVTSVYGTRVPGAGITWNFLDLTPYFYCGVIVLTSVDATVRQVNHIDMVVNNGKLRLRAEACKVEFITPNEDSDSTIILADSIDRTMFLTTGQVGFIDFEDISGSGITQRGIYSASIIA